MRGARYRIDEVLLPKLFGPPQVVPLARSPKCSLSRRAWAQRGKTIIYCWKRIKYDHPHRPVRTSVALVTIERPRCVSVHSCSLIALADLLLEMMHLSSLQSTERRRRQVPLRSDENHPAPPSRRTRVLHGPSNTVGVDVHGSAFCRSEFRTAASRRPAFDSRSFKTASRDGP